MAQRQQPRQYLFVDKQQAKQYLFVNKTAGSSTFSHSKGLAAASIQQHVQRHMRVASNEERRRGLQASSVVGTKISQEGFRFQQTGVEEEDPATKPVSSQKAGHNPVSRKQLGQSTQRYVVLGNSTEPFDCMAVKLSPAILTILRYHLFNPYLESATIKAHAMELSARHHRYFPIAEKVVKRGLENQVRLYALITATAARMTLFSGIPVPEANQLMYNAIQSMRTSLMEPDAIVNSDSILDICYLCIADRYRGNYDAALIHWKMIKSLITRLDLSLSFDRYVFNLISVINTLKDVDMVTPPLLPLTWLPGPLSRLSIDETSREQGLSLNEAEQERMGAGERSETARNRVRESTWSLPLLEGWPLQPEPHFPQADVHSPEQRSGRGLIEATNTGILCPAMVSIIWDIVLHLDGAKHVIYRSDPPDMGEDWFDETLLAVLHRLVQFSSSGIEECFRSALIMMMSSAATSLSGQTSMSNSLRLKEAILSLGDDPVSESRSLGLVLDRLYLWILLVGVFATTAGSVEEEWFQRRACKIASTLELKSYVQLCQLMGHFMAPDTLELISLSRLAARIVTDEK